MPYKYTVNDSNVSYTLSHPKFLQLPNFFPDGILPCLSVRILQEFCYFKFSLSLVHFDIDSARIFCIVVHLLCLWRHNIVQRSAVDLQELLFCWTESWMCACQVKEPGTGRKTLHGGHFRLNHFLLPTGLSVKFELGFKFCTWAKSYSIQKHAAVLDNCLLTPLIDLRQSPVILH